MKNFNKKSRRISTALLSTALIITLSSCSAATNNYGKLNKNEVYASIGDYKVTYGDLWNELKWSAIDVLNTQIEDIVLKTDLDNLTLVMENQYDQLTDDNKDSLGISDEEGFNKLYDKYKSRLIDYVVQDIYNFKYEIDDYWDGVAELKESVIKSNRAQYVDNVYTEYHKDTASNGKTYLEIIEESTKDDCEDLFLIAEDLKELYYKEYAKELLTYIILNEKQEEALKDDDDANDDTEGLYTHSEYVIKFQDEFTNTYDLNMLLINFTSNEEFENTLRAFGLKSLNNKFYFIKDNANDNYMTYLNSENRMSYNEYIDYYDEFTKTDLTKEKGVETDLSGELMLELYILIYNYMYAGYKTPLESTYSVKYNNLKNADLDDLRKIVYEVIYDFSNQDEKEYYKNTIKLLNDNYHDILTYSSSQLEDDYSANFKKYCYETLKLKDKNGIENTSTRYSTAIESVNDYNFIAYKFSDEMDAITDDTLKRYEEYYLDDTLTTIDFYDSITNEELNPGLKEQIEEYIVQDKMADTTIDSTIDELVEDVKVKIYVECVEIAYQKDHSNYSKAVKKAANSNILATITYNKKTYNLNIFADENDKKSIRVAGTNEAFGVFNYLERKNGPTTAIDLLNKEVIKDTKTFKDVKKDKENYNLYKTYITNVLTSFSNDGYAQSGYPSSLGKYNFLLLYFHSANINTIIDNYYMVQLASAKLLTNYANDSLAEFFNEYSNLAYEKYFSLVGKRLVIYMDADEDGEKDDPSDWKTNIVENWKKLDDTVGDVTLEYVAKELIYVIYNKVAAAAGTSHVDKITELVTEINDSAKVVYEKNIISNENTWAKYKWLGLNVTTEDLSVTNTTTDIDFNLKQRLYDYSSIDSYQYYINGTYPTEYIEELTIDSITNENDIVMTSDGFNMIILTKGNSKPSAKWSEDDYSDTLLKNIILKYNEEYVSISDIFNENDMLNSNQIMLYVLDYAINGESTISPSATSEAITAFLSPVVERFTSSETQRIITLCFLKNKCNPSENNLYDVVTFTKENYNGEGNYLNKLIEMSMRASDNYSDLIEDTTKTSDLYPDWWDKLIEKVNEFLITSEKEEA